MSLINNDATTARLSEGQEMKKQNTLSIFDNIRQGLAHPLPVTIKCVVASVNGLDSASTQDRAMVAMLLWAAGIPAEYLPQSSTFTSLMQHCDRESNKLGAFSSVSVLPQLFVNWFSCKQVLHSRVHLFVKQQLSGNELGSTLRAVWCIQYPICRYRSVPFTER